MDNLQDYGITDTMLLSGLGLCTAGLATMLGIRDIRVTGKKLEEELNGLAKQYANLQRENAQLMGEVRELRKRIDEEADSRKTFEMRVEQKMEMNEDRQRKALVAQMDDISRLNDDIFRRLSYEFDPEESVYNIINRLLVESLMKGRVVESVPGMDELRKHPKNFTEADSNAFVAMLDSVLCQIGEFVSKNQSLSKQIADFEGKDFGALVILPDNGMPFDEKTMAPINEVVDLDHAVVQYASVIGWNLPTLHEFKQARVRLFSQNARICDEGQVAEKKLSSVVDKHLAKSRKMPENDVSHINSPSTDEVVTVVQFETGIASGSRGGDIDNARRKDGLD